MGIGAGLAASPSTAAILEFTSPERAKSAASATMGAQAIGFAAALLVGGASTEYGPWPTRLCSWILAVLLLILLAVTWFLPRHTGGDAGGGRRSRMPSVPKDVRRAFAMSSTAMIICSCCSRNLTGLQNLAVRKNLLRRYPSGSPRSSRW